MFALPALPALAWNVEQGWTIEQTSYIPQLLPQPQVRESRDPWPSLPFVALWNVADVGGRVYNEHIDEPVRRMAPALCTVELWMYLFMEDLHISHITYITTKHKLQV